MPAFRTHVFRVGLQVGACVRIQFAVLLAGGLPRIELRGLGSECLVNLDLDQDGLATIAAALRRFQASEVPST